LRADQSAGRHRVQHHRPESAGALMALPLEKTAERKISKIDRLAELTARRETATGGSLWVETLRRLRSSKMALIGAAIIAVFVVIAIVGPLLAPYDPVAQTWRGEVFPNRGVFVGPRDGNW